MWVQKCNWQAANRIKLEGSKNGGTLPLFPTGEAFVT